MIGFPGNCIIHCKPKIVNLKPKLFAGTKTYEKTISCFSKKIPLKTKKHPCGCFFRLLCSVPFCQPGIAGRIIDGDAGLDVVAVYIEADALSVVLDGPAFHLYARRDKV